MKKFIQAAGVVSGALALSSSASIFDIDGNRPWTVSLAVKGFYDDNIYARQGVSASGIKLKEDSVGLDVSPSLRFNVPLDQGSVNFGYQYGMRWYEARNDNKIDQYHIITGDFTHNFNSRFKLDVYDSFAVAQEPEQLSTGGTYVPFRSLGDNIRNNGGVEFSAQITRPLSVVFSYRNNYYDFSEKSGFVDPATGAPIGSAYGPLLDRMEQTFGPTFRYQILPSTVLLGGYEYGIMDFKHAERRLADNTSHYLFAGAEHNFTSQLTGAVRLGAQITDFDRLHVTDTTPYADANLRYNYDTGSYAQLGVKHMRMATDVPYIGHDGTGALQVTDTETTSFYGLVSHSFTPRMKSGLIAQFQNSDYQFGKTGYKKENEQYIGLGASFTYQFTHWLAGEANYYFDNRDSSVYDGKALDYTRNRIFLGVRLTY